MTSRLGKSTASETNGKSRKSSVKSKLMLVRRPSIALDQIKSDINKRIELDESDFHTARKSNAILEKIDERTINIINESNSTSSRVEHNFETIYQSQEFKNKSIENEFMKLKNERYHSNFSSKDRSQFRLYRSY